MDNIQSDIVLEFQKSIDNMTRFGQELETLDGRFGRLDQRIDAMRSSLSSLSSQVSRGAGGNLRRQLEQEMNSIIQGNGVVLGQVGSAPFKVSKETVRGVFQKVETELNAELQKFVRNMQIDIDSNYAKGQRLPIGNDDFDAINKEVAKVIKLQVTNLVNAIQKHKANLIKPETLEGLQLSIGKSTVLALVNKIKDEVIKKIENPVVAEASELKITKADLNKVVTQVKEKLKKAFEVDVADVKSLDAKDVNNRIRKIPEDIDKGLSEYINKTVAGINGAMKGKMEVPVGELGKKMRRVIARELQVSVDQLDNLGTVDLGSVRGMELKAQLDRVAKALDRKMSKSVSEEIDQVIKSINEVEIIPSPKLKRHLISQINRINNKLIEKIREQVDVQVDSIIQEISEVTNRPKSLNRDQRIRNAGNLDMGRVGGSTESNNSNSDDSRRRPVISGGDTYARRDSLMNGFGLQSAITNTMRHILAGGIVGAPMMAMYQAIETFKNVQTEQIKMTQNLMLKDAYNKDETTGKTLASPNFGKVEATVKELQSFIRQQSVFYGTDYNQLYQVGGIGSRLLEDPLEMKKFVQLTAQLKTADPGSDPINIANGLESIKSQYGLEMADMTAKVAQPLAAVSNLTNASIESLIDSMKRMGATANGGNVDPQTAIILAGVTKQATALEGANIGNFYNSVINRSQSSKALNKMSELGVDPYYGTDDAAVYAKTQSPEATAKMQELGIDGTMIDATGARMVKGFDEILQEMAKKLAGMDDKTKRDAYDAMFGTYQSSKGSATMHEILNTFVKVQESTNSFGKDQYDQMIKKSLDNPLVNANRAKESVTVAFDSMVQEMTPAINKVSYALLNMAESVAKNAQLFVSLGDVLSNVLIGMLMMKGIKWGGQKVWGNVSPNFDREKGRTGFLRSVGEMGGLLGDDLKNMGRKDVGRLQKDPLLDRYVREMHTMTQEQKDHFKNYVSTKKIDVKDIPTMFTAMDEAKNWKARDPLNDAEKFDRHKQYNNRLATRADLANILDPSFVQTMNNHTANRETYGNHLTQVLGYSDVSNRMTGMSQKEFRGFEDHLAEGHRNGMPAVNSYARLNEELTRYEEHQRAADTAARQSHPTFGSLSNAVRGMNSELTRTQSLKNGFKQFFKDIPDLGRGALSSIKNLTGGIAKMALEIAAAIGLAEVAKSITWEMSSTESQRQLAIADTNDKKLTAGANYLRKGKEGNGGFLGFMSGMYGDAMNLIDGWSGSAPSHAGYFTAGGSNEVAKGVLQMLNKDNGANLKSLQDLYKYLADNKDNPQMNETVLVNKWADKTGRTGANEKIRQTAIDKQYEEAQLNDAEQRRLQDIADKHYKEKYKAGALKFPTIDVAGTQTRIQDGLKVVKDNSSIQTLQALMGGMKTDSQDYIKMRQDQVKAERAVLEDELAIIDKYILNAQNILDKADPNSQEYKDAQAAKDSLTKTRDTVKHKSEQDIVQDEYNLYMENYQKAVGKSDRKMQKIDLIAQAKELAAAYNMDNQSQAYLDAMKSIAVNKVSQMKAELENMKNIQAMGDQSEELAMKIQQTQNSISSEQAKVKEYNLASIGIGRERLGEHNSDRENELLSLKLTAGNPDDTSPILRNKRIANYKSEVAEISSVIKGLQGRLPGATGDEVKKIQSEIRDLNKQSLQAQLGILDEMKASAGTFNMPNGVTAMSRYEYLTRQGTHSSTTVGMGDVTVHITLPNVTNGASPQQLQNIGQGLGQGLSQGRVGGIRQQLGGNPMSGYRSRYGN